MCGIAGIINLVDKLVDKNVLEGMVSVQRHRGPDDMGIYLDGRIGLGHSRLSIIDLSKDAHQPMFSEDGKIVIVHNGEIYNYVELKAELEKAGHRFRSKSDTEVIIHGYEEWGEDCVKRFNGMWAFAICDLRKGILYGSRDRLGVKPFYYYFDGKVFVFASEIKAILKHPAVNRQPNDETIFGYLASGYGYMDISDNTFFKDIKQLRPGHSIGLTLAGKKFTQTRYWDLDPGRRLEAAREEDVYERFRDLFKDSVKLRLRSDVSVGVSLSGGLDSSSITCVASDLLKGHPLETFSSCFDEEEYDERKFIRPVLEKTNANANFIFTKPDNLFDEMEKIIWHQDEPYSTLSIFPQWYVMKLAREKGVKVLLTGQGGDEILAGYHKYYFYLFADLIYSMKWTRALREMKLYRDIKGGDNIARKVARIMISHASPKPLKEAVWACSKRNTPPYLDKDFVASNSNRVFTERRFGSILNNDLYNALKVSPLPSLLHIDDRSSMAHSVESRSPFLDYRLVEYLFSLGPEYKIRDGITKYVLRRSLKHVLPEEVSNRRDKMGFATPLDRWFRTILKDKVYDILSSKEFSRRPYFNQEHVLARFKDYIDGKDKNAHYALWSWVNLELWFRKFIDAN